MSMSYDLIYFLFQSRSDKGLLILPSSFFSLAIFQRFILLPHVFHHWSCWYSPTWIAWLDFFFSSDADGIEICMIPVSWNSSILLSPTLKFACQVCCSSQFKVSKTNHLFHSCTCKYSWVAFLFTITFNLGTEFNVCICHISIATYICTTLAHVIQIHMIQKWFFFMFAFQSISKYSFLLHVHTIASIY